MRRQWKDTVLPLHFVVTNLSRTGLGEQPWQLSGHRLRVAHADTHSSSLGTGLHSLILAPLLLGGGGGGQGGRAAPLPTPALIPEALGPWEALRASLRHPLPSLLPSSPVTQGGRLGRLGLLQSKRLLSEAQRCFSFLCYIWRLMSQEWLPRGENPKGAGSR